MSNSVSSNNNRSRSGLITNVKIEQLNVDKEVVSSTLLSNRVTKHTLVGLVRWLAGEFNPTNQLSEPKYIPRYIGIGVGTKSVSVSDTHLDMEVPPYNDIYPPLDDEGNPVPIPDTMRFPIETRIINTYSSSASCAVRFKAYIPRDAYRGVTIKEVGLFSDETGNNALARVRLSENQFIVRKTTSDYYLSIEWIVIVESVESSAVDEANTTLLGSVWKPIGWIGDDISVDYWDEDLSEGSVDEDSSVISTSSSVSQVYDFEATPTLIGVNLSWTNPDSKDYAGVIIVRKAGSIPKYLSDGVRVYDGQSTACIDTTVERDVTYYYRAYAYNTSLKYNATEEVYAKVKVASIVVPQVRDLIVVGHDSDISLSFKTPSTEDWTRIVVLRSEEDYPTSESADVIQTIVNIDNNLDQTHKIVDSTVDRFKLYYYTILTYYNSFISDPVHASSITDNSVYSIQVNIPSDSKTFTITTKPSSPVYIDWGDNTYSSALDQVETTHQYSLAGLYTVRFCSLRSNSPKIGFTVAESDAPKITKINSWDNSFNSYDLSYSSVKSLPTPVSLANDTLYNGNEATIIRSITYTLDNDVVKIIRYKPINTTYGYLEIRLNNSSIHSSSNTVPTVSYWYDQSAKTFYVHNGTRVIKSIKSDTCTETYDNNELAKVDYQINSYDSCNTFELTSENAKRIVVEDLLNSKYLIIAVYGNYIKAVVTEDPNELIVNPNWGPSEDDTRYTFPDGYYVEWDWDRVGSTYGYTVGGVSRSKGSYRLRFKLYEPDGTLYRYEYPTGIPYSYVIVGEDDPDYEDPFYIKFDPGTTKGEFIVRYGIDSGGFPNSWTSMSYGIPWDSSHGFGGQPNNYSNYYKIKYQIDDQFDHSYDMNIDRVKVGPDLSPYYNTTYLVLEVDVSGKSPDGSKTYHGSAYAEHFTMTDKKRISSIRVFSESLSYYDAMKIDRYGLKLVSEDSSVIQETLGSNNIYAGDDFYAHKFESVITKSGFTYTVKTTHHPDESRSDTFSVYNSFDESLLGDRVGLEHYYYVEWVGNYEDPMLTIINSSISQLGLPSTYLIDNEIPLTNMDNAFKDNTNLLSVAGILARTYGPSSSFKYMLSGCTSLSVVNTDIFSGLSSDSKIDFTGLFKGDSKLSSAPKLWIEYPNSIHSECYSGCTNLEWYDDIPDDWK